MLAVAFSRFFLAPMRRWEQGLLIAGALFTIIPNHLFTVIGLILASPAFVRQIMVYRTQKNTMV